MAGGFWKELQRGAKVSGCGNCCRLLGLTEIVSKSKKLMSDAFSEVTSIYYCGQEGSGLGWWEGGFSCARRAAAVEGTLMMPDVCHQQV